LRCCLAHLPLAQATRSPATVLRALGLRAEGDLRLRTLDCEGASSLVAAFLGFALALDRALSFAQGGIRTLEFGGRLFPFRRTQGSEDRPTNADEPHPDWIQLEDAVHRLQKLAVVARDQEAAAPGAGQRIERRAARVIENVWGLGER